jgi:queuine tRNA-ribosyltransferase
MSFKIIKKSKSNLARVGKITTLHGVIATPAFMPCATLGAVKTMLPREVAALGFSVILANAYHLYLRPGIDLIKKMGGLHSLIGWSGPILTDSGGFQIFSLGRGKRDRKIPDDNNLRPEVKIFPSGVEFKSHLDGSKHFFTPEKVIDLELALGADMIMVLDVCTEYPASYQRAKETMEITHQWARRSIKYWQLKKNSFNAGKRPLLFGIVQGSTYRDLRKKSAQLIGTLPFDGIAVGGVSVGEGKKNMTQVLKWIGPLLPPDRPHYLMGVGEPEDLIMAHQWGFDLFDCVLPTRLARHGTVWTTSNWKKFSKIDLRKAGYKQDKKVLMDTCGCLTCSSGFSRAFIHHLIRSGEVLGIRLTTIHNLYLIQKLIERLGQGVRTLI